MIWKAGCVVLCWVIEIPGSNENQDFLGIYLGS